jgi:hypothetical protein
VNKQEEINKPNKRIKSNKGWKDRGVKKKLLLRGTVKKFKLVKAW